VLPSYLLPPPPSLQTTEHEEEGLLAIEMALDYTGSEGIENKYRAEAEAVPAGK
jgi:hypothetical protein